MDRYVVIGNPVSHSLSPEIHARFARDTGERLEYGALFAPLGEFAATLGHFFGEGGRGANVTLPFKIEAFRFAHAVSDRARLAGAANFLSRQGDLVEADNTDGAGLVSDLERNLGVQLRGRRVLLLGAGGAARGVIAPLLAQQPERLVIANRTAERARELVAHFPSSRGVLEAASLGAIPDEGFHLVVNATSSSTRGETLDWPATSLAPQALAYDLAYGPASRPFRERAAAYGARTADGLGMLVEQAAESFWLWRGRRPATAKILAELRSRFA